MTAILHLWRYPWAKRLHQNLHSWSSQAWHKMTIQQIFKKPSSSATQHSAGWGQRTTESSKPAGATEWKSILKKHQKSWVWRCITMIPALRRLRWTSGEFKDSLVYKFQGKPGLHSERPCSPLPFKQQPPQKNKTNLNNQSHKYPAS